MSVPYHAWTHRPKAEGGTDPIEMPSGGTEAALLNDLDPSASVSITANTWTIITASGRVFDEGWQSDGSWTLSNNAATGGNFARNEFALYEVWASVQFGNSANDELIGVSIQFSASSDHIYPNIIPVKVGQARVTVTAHWWGTLTTPVKFYCYTSVTRNIRMAELFVRRFELNADGTINTY